MRGKTKKETTSGRENEAFEGLPGLPETPSGTIQGARATPTTEEVEKRFKELKGEGLTDDLSDLNELLGVYEDEERYDKATKEKLRRRFPNMDEERIKFFKNEKTGETMVKAVYVSTKKMKWTRWKQLFVYDKKYGTRLSSKLGVSEKRALLSTIDVVEGFDERIDATNREFEARESSSFLAESTRGFQEGIRRFIEEDRQTIEGKEDQLEMAELGTMTKNIEGLVGTIKHLEGQLGENQAALDATTKELEKAIDRAGRAEDKVERSRMGVNEEKAELEIENQNLRTAYKELEEELGGLKDLLEKIEDPENVEELRKEIESLEARREELYENMSLKDKVKYIFKKYGVTAISVLAAVGTVIGVIISNMKAGLTSVAKGVGNGLKAIGKKLGQILPGMVGAIVSFLFRAAGEAVGFLAKHAWLLILLVVTFVVEQFKKSGERKK